MKLGKQMEPEAQAATDQQQQKRVERPRQVETVRMEADRNEEETESKEVRKRDAVRDAGVSDEDWAQLEEAKKEYNEKMARFQSEKDAAIKEEERKSMKS